MSYTLTISKDDDKLVIVQKPVLQTRWDRLKMSFGCITAISFVGAIVCLPAYFTAENSDEAYARFMAILFAFAIVFLSIIILVIRDKFRDRRKPKLPPDYDHVIHTFNAEQFTIQHQGMEFPFAYRFDAKPVLRRRVYLDRWDVMIPCNPLTSHVPASFNGGFYIMEWLDNADAERILSSIEEHLKTVASRMGQQ